MNVGINATGGKNLALTGDHFRARADNDGHPLLHIGVTGLADTHNTAVFQPHIRFHNAPVIQNHHVGDHRIHGFTARTLTLPHAVPDYFATAEFHLVTVDGIILLNFNKQLGVAKPYPIPHRGAKHFAIGASINFSHYSFPITMPRKPYTVLSPA